MLLHKVGNKLVDKVYALIKYNFQRASQTSE